jgi:hypothetical protein
MIAYEPNPLIPAGMIGLTGKLNDFKVIGCLPSPFFRIPIMKHIITWTGMTSHNEENIAKLIRDGYTPCISPNNDSLSMSNSDYNCDVIIVRVKSYRAIIKLALQDGLTIFPSFCFGQEKLWNKCVIKPESILFKIFEKIHLSMFIGMLNIPFGPPNTSQLNIVIGKSITIPRIENPSNEVLINYQTQLASEITNIFLANKDNYNMSHYTIKIV